MPKIKFNVISKAKMATKRKTLDKQKMPDSKEASLFKTMSEMAGTNVTHVNQPSVE
tara:strand:- start:1298 stop:1465 length:168 start_codon:yes stop_codon:yes gene_type:complete